MVSERVVPAFATMRCLVIGVGGWEGDDGGGENEDLSTYLGFCCLGKKKIGEQILSTSQVQVRTVM